MKMETRTTSTRVRRITTESKRSHDRIFTERFNDISELSSLYEFRDDQAVESFLEENAFLGSLLFLTHKRAREYFGPGVRLAVKVIKDPEVGEDRRLFVLIPTEMHPDEALDRLDELYDDWWLDVLSKADHKMSIDVEYV
jgi:hypothetical protein